jgi:DNA-binding response OmpR family regulator
MNLLVVEDDPRICDVLEYALKADGYSVCTTNRGREAVALCGKNPPDLIVLDVGLPDIDCFEVCRLIRKDSVLVLGTP